MATALSGELKNHVGEKVTVRGWLHTIRLVGGKLAFVILRDRQGLMQVVLEGEEEINKLDGCLMGTVLRVQGLVKEAAKTKFGYEIGGESVEVIRAITHPSPIDISKDEINAEMDTIHDNKVVALRHPRQMRIFKVASVVERYMREFFDQNDFTQINTPKIIAFPTEGGAEVFKVDYFGRDAYLAQSPQFYKQIMSAIFERVYEIGRAYRAEKSNTSRHMSEIMMLDVETAFIDGMDDLLALAEQFLMSVIENTWTKAESQLTALGAQKPVLAEKFPRITVKELHELMLKETGEDYTKELDVVPAEERFICEYSAKNRWSEAVFVTEFPWSDAKFYHHQSPTNPEVTDRADLLFRGVELATITQREVWYDKLIQQIKDRDLDPENPGLKHYLDAFKYGMADTGGRGFGIARFIQKLIGLENVKDAELFPRDTTRITP